MILSIIDKQKETILQYIVKWLGYIFIVGIAIHFITTFVHLPSFGIIKSHYGGDFYGPECYNYLFCIKPVIAAHNGLFRFSGPFLVEVQNLFQHGKREIIRIKLLSGISKNDEASI